MILVEFITVPGARLLHYNNFLYHTLVILRVKLYMHNFYRNKDVLPLASCIPILRSSAIQCIAKSLRVKVEIE